MITGRITPLFAINALRRLLHDIPNFSPPSSLKRRTIFPARISDDQS